MSDRRNRPPNRWGCKPIEDVCVQHDEPLICRHGCGCVERHVCKDLGVAQIAEWNVKPWYEKEAGGE